MRRFKRTKQGYLLGLHIAIKKHLWRWLVHIAASLPDDLMKQHLVHLDNKSQDVSFWHLGALRKNYICCLLLLFIFLTTFASVSLVARTPGTEWLSNWHSAPLQRIAPILNVKQIWHGALIVNNLAQALGSANRGASTFSSYQGLLFLQLPSCLYSRQVSS